MDPVVLLISDLSPLCYRWQCFWNFKRLPITLSPQTKKTLACLNFEHEAFTQHLALKIYVFCVHCNDAVHIQEQMNP